MMETSAPPAAIPGLHHVTAIAGDPQRNLAFYGGLLGLRLVKVTVNFDDPSVHHVYYGDQAGTPGTILTFFPYPRVKPGRLGAGQAAVVGLRMPPSALGYWVERLIGHGVRFEGPARRFGAQTLAFQDPDGLPLELVAAPTPAGRAPSAGGSVPAERAVHGLHAVTLWEDEATATARFLTDTLGFRPVAEEEGRIRYAAGAAGSGTLVEVRPTPGFWPGVVAAGTIHHVAWRVLDEAQLATWRERLAGAGLDATPVRNRHYFRSVYFHEPGGVLFELATDGPGFAIDEPPGRLGEGLQLPPWLEERRAEIGRRLPPLHLPRVG